MIGKTPKMQRLHGFGPKYQPSYRRDMNGSPRRPPISPRAKATSENGQPTLSMLDRFAHHRLAHTSIAATRHRPVIGHFSISAMTPNTSANLNVVPPGIVSQRDPRRLKPSNVSESKYTMQRHGTLHQTHRHLTKNMIEYWSTVTNIWH